MFIWYFSREKLIGIGGLNEDPYTENNKIGRVRRFYIAKRIPKERSREVTVIANFKRCEKYFNIVVLHTDTEQGDKFYTSSGFVKGTKYVGASHYVNIYKRI